MENSAARLSLEAIHQPITPFHHASGPNSRSNASANTHDTTKLAASLSASHPLTCRRAILRRLWAAALGGRVKFTGLVDDAQLKRYVAWADALVLPSFYEGFGLPPLEAMACGCPAIVSDRASLPEVCGDAVLYCDPNDVEDIAARMLEVAASEATRAGLREKGLRRARQFTWDKCARETLVVIERLQS